MRAVPSGTATPVMLAAGQQRSSSFAAAEVDRGVGGDLVPGRTLATHFQFRSRICWRPAPVASCDS